jgi:hypothetical protein
MPFTNGTIGEFDVPQISKNNAKPLVSVVSRAIT